MTALFKPCCIGKDTKIEERNKKSRDAPWENRLLKERLISKNTIELKKIVIFT